MIHNILILVNSYTSRLRNINKQFLNKYEYVESLHFKNNELIAYNWRNARCVPWVRNTIYTVRGDTMYIVGTLPESMSK